MTLMLNCKFCSATFETKEIDTGHSNPAKRAAAEAALAEQTAAGERWVHVYAVATMDGASVNVLAFDCCGDCAAKVKAGGLKVSL